MDRLTKNGIQLWFFSFDRIYRFFLPLLYHHIYQIQFWSEAMKRNLGNEESVLALHASGSYCISVVIRQVFFLFQSKTKSLDPSYKRNPVLRLFKRRKNSPFGRVKQS